MKDFHPLDLRISLGWALVMFFAQLSGRKWTDLPINERFEVHAYAESMRALEARNAMAEHCSCLGEDVCKWCAL